MQILGKMFALFMMSILLYGAEQKIEVAHQRLEQAELPVINQLADKNNAAVEKGILRFEIDHQDLAVAMRKERDKLLREQQNKVYIANQLHTKYDAQLLALGMQQELIDELINGYAQRAQMWDRQLAAVAGDVKKRALAPLIGTTLFKPILVHTIQGNFQPVCINTAGTVLAVLDTSRKMHLFCKNDGAWDEKLSSDKSAESVCMSQDGSIVAISCANVLEIYLQSSGRWDKTATSISGKIRSLAMSKDGSLIAVCCTGKIELYAKKSSNWIKTKTITGSGESVAINGDGTDMAIGFLDKVVLYSKDSHWSANAEIEGISSSIALADDGTLCRINFFNKRSALYIKSGKHGRRFLIFSIKIQ